MGVRKVSNSQVTFKVTQGTGNGDIRQVTHDYPVVFHCNCLCLAPFRTYYYLYA